MQPIGEPRQLDALVARAAALAGAWGASAASSTSVGQERAILRLFGVAGLDRQRRPLAAEVVDRYLAPDPRRLGGGIALPFAMAMAEYDLPPHELALEIAAGNVDLGLEAELLAEPDRRAIAVADATRLARLALDRIDANRTARRELLDVLGDPPRPWLGAALVSPAIVDAIDEARAAVDAGAELIRVDVPPSRELAERMARIGGTLEAWRPSATSRGGLDAFDPSGSPIPTGSQRAISVLRRFVDEAGARRRAYVRLATDAPSLAAPDQAVVAAFERIDVVVADPMREIVTGRIDPDRALADHVFAHRLLARAGTRVLLPAGPLLVIPDLALGVPSDPATRSGRALALQLLAIALARRDGLPDEAIIVGALPDWIMDEPESPARAAAEIALRHALLPGLALALGEPPGRDDPHARWQAVVGALLPEAGDVQMIVRRSYAGLEATVGIRDAATSLRASRVPSGLVEVAAAHAAGAVAAAIATIGALEDGGWRALVDQPLGIRGEAGADSIADRTGAFDPLLAEVAARA